MSELLSCRFDERAALYFRLRSGLVRDPLQDTAARFTSAFAGAPGIAFLMIDPAVAGWQGEWSALVDAATELPEEIAGIPARRIIHQVAAALADCEAAHPRAVAELVAADRGVVDPEVARLHSCDALDDAVRYVAGVFGSGVPERPIDVALVADGIFRGGLTGETLDDRPMCFVATAPHRGTTLFEAVLHEAIHALPGGVTDRLIPGAPGIDVAAHDEMGQAWHVPFFLTAADAVRRYVDSTHTDYGDTHGYYAKLPATVGIVRGPWSEYLAGAISANDAVDRIHEAMRAAT